ncbi:MAG: DUF2948 family protein [Proteobacteria bacterium]|nr:DUF2948 family protein [Pseudomonadota bacterium]
MEANTRRKLIALDADDFAVISANVQDAVVRVGDIIWRRDENRVVLGMVRVDWDGSLTQGVRPRRLHSALRFDRVLSCKSRNIDPELPDAALDLLAIEFRPGDAPGGQIVLLFAGGGAFRLDVECLECELADLGPYDLGIGECALAPQFGV